MCRWFAYISPTEPCLLEDVLVTPAHSLSKQVNAHYLPNLVSHVPGSETTSLEISRRNKFNNVDGFGVAWYTSSRQDYDSSTTGPRPAVYKHDQPPTNDANFHSICAHTSTLTLFAHIRSATATAVTPINSHPFTFGRHTIMHNGVIASFSSIRRDLLLLLNKDIYENVHGTTDSEHLSALYMTYLTAAAGGGKSSWEKQYSLSEMKAALTAAFTTVIQLQFKILGKEKVDASSLNVCCTDGSRMISFRFRNHAIEQPPSLYLSKTAGVTLNHKYPDNADGSENRSASRKAKDHGAHVIVASEPTTYNAKEWELIEKNHAALVDEDGSVKVEPIEVDEKYLATVMSTSHG
jgi:glutamine amidotransferase